MYKEVSAKEALQAAMEGKPALQIHSYHEDPEEELMVENLTEKIREIVKRKEARYLIDILEEKAEEPAEEPKAVLTEPKESEDSESKYEMVQPEKEPEKEPKEEPNEQKSTLENFHVYKGKRGRRPTVDVGEIMALHRAGWPDKQIAEEVKASVATVKKYISKAEKESGIR